MILFISRNRRGLSRRRLATGLIDYCRIRVASSRSLWALWRGSLFSLCKRSSLEFCCNTVVTLGSFEKILVHMSAIKKAAAATINQAQKKFEHGNHCKRTKPTAILAGFAPPPR
jgi:hypothetical protein